MATSTKTVGLLHPGEMGSAVGATLVAGGAKVLWASEGRSAATRARAAELGLEDAGTIGAVARASEVIVSVAPPHGAIEVARAVAALGFRGVYVDANAVAPARGARSGPSWRRPAPASSTAASSAPRTGSRERPGSISPGRARPRSRPSSQRVPSTRSSSTRPREPPRRSRWPMRAGPRAARPCSPRCAPSPSRRAWSAALLAEWKISQPDVPARSERAFSDNARKAWRFVGEMDEIASFPVGGRAPRGISPGRPRDLHAACRLQGHGDAAHRRGRRQDAARQGR